MRLDIGHRINQYNTFDLSVYETTSVKFEIYDDRIVSRHRLNTVAMVYIHQWGNRRSRTMRVDDDRECPNNSCLVHVVVRVTNSAGLLGEIRYSSRVSDAVK